MSRPWMPLYIGDYRGDTAHLSAAQHGAYLLLMMHYWQHGGLPDDDAQLARIAAGMPIEQWQEMRPTIQAFFHDGWRHKRIDAEMAKSHERSAAGRKGGRPKANEKQTAKQTESKLKAPQPQPQSYSEAVASDAAASSARQPIYTDSKHELWGEGVPILTDLGLKDAAARASIGRWLRDTGDDAQRVLGAIQRARDARAIDPIPWITQGLKTGRQAVCGASNGTYRNGAHDGGSARARGGQSFASYAVSQARAAGASGA